MQPHITSHIAHQRKKKTGGALPSSIIKKDKLVPASHIFQKYPKLLCESRIGTLAVKLAKDAYFGEDVMVQCTVAGERDLPGLPLDELHQLKQALYMQFHQFFVEGGRRPGTPRHVTYVITFERGRSTAHCLSPNASHPRTSAFRFPGTSRSIFCTVRSLRYSFSWRDSKKKRKVSS